MRAFAALLAVVGVLGLSACDGGTEFTCSEEIPCEGFGETCVAGQCEVLGCSSNIDCPMENVCGAGGTCQRGCDNDNDCYPGNICDPEANECVTGGCSDTQIDCGYKEFCNRSTGECYEAGGVYCRPCDPRNVVDDCNGGDAGGTNECWNNYCTVDCSNGGECPSGFQCYPFTDRAGNPISYQCLTYCWLYEDRAAGSDVLPPPADIWLPQHPDCAPEALLPSPTRPGEGR